MNEVFHTSPNIMWGTPVFIGTRVPVQALFDYLKAGESIETFLDDFPTVKKDQVLALLDLAKEELFEVPQPL